MLAVADDAPARPKCELAHVFREYGEDYRRTHCLPFSHRRVMRAIEHCRTSALGGHMEQCNLCGFEHPAYDSCRNRHCPKCQSLTKARWLEKQNAKLLPVGAFHLVFTLSHELNPLILVNPVPRTYVRGFRACPSGTSEHSSLHLHTGRSVVRGKSG